VDASYGQGVAVGDYNSDGFADVYVANFGSNRLYQNMGDGRFRDVTEQAGVGGDQWTTSCMMADLDGDSLPEIYAVTYALKDEVLELHCQHQDRARTCAPTLFTAEQDLLYHNRGDGSFENITQPSGIIAPDGKGLAIVAADFEQRGRLDVFVANDTSANFFFHNETGEPGAKLRFKEEAIVNGVGFDELGNPPRLVWDWPLATRTATAHWICSSPISMGNRILSICKAMTIDSRTQRARHASVNQAFTCWALALSSSMAS